MSFAILKKIWQVHGDHVLVQITKICNICLGSMNHHGIHKKSCEFMGRWTIHPVDSLQLDRWIHLHLELHAASNLHNFGWEAGAVSSRIKNACCCWSKPSTSKGAIWQKWSLNLVKACLHYKLWWWQISSCYCVECAWPKKGHADVTGSWIGWVQLFHFPPCTWHHESLSSLTGKSSFYSLNASRAFVTMHFY